MMSQAAASKFAPELLSETQMHLKISWPFTTPQVREDFTAEENKKQPEVAEQSKLPSS